MPNSSNRSAGEERFAGGITTTASSDAGRSTEGSTEERVAGERSTGNGSAGGRSSEEDSSEKWTNLTKSWTTGLHPSVNSNTGNQTNMNPGTKWIASLNYERNLPLDWIPDRLLSSNFKSMVKWNSYSNRRYSSNLILFPSSMVGLLFFVLLVITANVGPCYAKKTVIIVGAGMAGAAAASTLVAEGGGKFEVVVLEGRNRVGGRMYSRFGNLSDGRSAGPAEMGAQWIQTSVGNPVTELAKKYKLSLSETGDSEMYFRPNGTRHTDAENDLFSQRFNSLLDKALNWADKQSNDTSLETAFLAVNQTEFLTPEIQWQCAQNLEDEFGGALSQLSAWYGTDDSEFGGDDKVVPAGYDTIPRKLMEDAVKGGARLLLNHTVTRVVQTSGSVTLSTMEGSNFTGDYVIVTVPLGVLKAGSITFAPALSSSKLGAIQRLGFGKVEKVMVWYKEALWPNDYGFFGFEENEIKFRGRFAGCVNRLIPWGETALECAALGDYSLGYSNLTSGQIKSTLVAKLSQAFPKLKGVEPVDYWFSSWATDPLTLGCYSFAALGSTNKDFDVMAKPEGRILFAGEATHIKYRGTVHGAYLSGLREANRLIKPYNYKRIGLGIGLGLAFSLFLALVLRFCTKLSLGFALGLGLVLGMSLTLLLVFVLG